MLFSESRFEGDQFKIFQSISFILIFEDKEKNCLKDYLHTDLEQVV